jgi:anti-anti-sigma factor
VTLPREAPGGVPLECRVEFAGDTAVAVPAGELAFDTVVLLDRRLEAARAAGADEVVLDLGQTTFVDSAALHLMLVWHERARCERFAFALARVPRRVRRVIDAAGIRDRLSCLSPEP